MELTPRTLEESQAGGDGDGGDVVVRPVRKRRRWLPMGLLCAVVLALGFLVVKGLGDATLYFRNVDEAVAQREDLGDKRFRLQGTVVDDAVPNGEGVAFDVEYNGVTATVHHVGSTPDMFEPGVPVVLEGRWDPSGAFFDSDRMLIKHDSEYESEEDYEERMNEAEEGG